MYLSGFQSAVWCSLWYTWILPKRVMLLPQGDPSRKYSVVRSYKICKGYQNTVKKAYKNVKFANIKY